MHHPAKNTDPDTSHDAARHVVRTGLAAVQQDQTVAAVRKYPGHTALEIATKLGIDRYMLGRRLSECEKAGRVLRGPAKTCSVSERRAHTWSIPA